MSINELEGSEVEEAKKLFSKKLELLKQPFEVDDVYWLPQSTKGSTAIAAAYANKRVYTDRLDEVLGAECWQIEIDTPVTTDYTKNIKEKRANWKDSTSELLVAASQEKGFKVMVKARCGLWVDYLKQWVWKSSTGVAPAEDENSITTAEAQAVKRAISMWGPGNYFYSLGTQTVPYNSITKQFSTKPTLPDWAIPVRKCEDCNSNIKSFEWKDKDGIEHSMTASDVLKNGRTKYQADLCVSCQKIRKEQAI
jgi:hypothetical protein